MTKDILILTVVISLFFAFWLGAYPLLTPDEARYSEVAREMVVTGNYITPHLNGVVMLDKPIFHYWLQATAIKLFGLSEWALRLCPALFGVLGCLFTYIAGRLLFERRTGLLAAIILATSPLYFFSAHYANLDMEIAVLISAALFTFLIAVKYSRLYLLWIAYIFAGLAVLTKGLIGIMLPALIIGIWILWQKQWQVLRSMYLWSGLLLVILIASPWYILVQKANPDFFQHFFIGEQFLRYLTPNFANHQPIWFYIPIILLGFFPWSLFLFCRGEKSFALEKSFAHTDFLYIWIIVVLLFFSLPSSKLVSYILPVFPPLALLIANKIKKPIITLAIINSIILLALLVFVPQNRLPTVKPLIMVLNSMLQPNDIVVSYYNYYYDLPFYTRRQVSVVADWDTFMNGSLRDNWKRELWQGRNNQLAKTWLINNATFLQKWHSPQRVFALVNVRYYDKLNSAVNHQVYPISRYQNTLLVKNHAN